MIVIANDMILRACAGVRAPISYPIHPPIQHAVPHGLLQETVPMSNRRNAVFFSA